MIKDTFWTDDLGVNMLSEFLLTFVISTFIFSIVTLSSTDVFIDTPRKIVCTNQFIDIGNDINTKIIDTYMIAPGDGFIRTDFKIPYEAAGYSYDVIITGSPNGKDREVTVRTADGDIEVSMTLNGVNSTIPINGSTSSIGTVHSISYESI